MNTPEIPHATLTRRNLLKTVGAGALLALFARPLFGEVSSSVTPAPTVGAAAAGAAGAYVLPPLGYAYDALEPYIDARTMELHHTKHHQAFITNLNKLMATLPMMLPHGPVALLSNLETVPEPARTTIRNNLGGHMNHSFFWDCIGPVVTHAPGPLQAEIEQTFGSLDAFKEQFTTAAMTRFGSGWAWLLLEKGKLVIRSTPNQDSPLMDGAQPLIGLDVWEHAYYLKYQNRRAEYVTAFWTVLNWSAAEARYASLKTPAAV
jgi:superoxide dismutase, Fe-Mn family